MLSLPSRERGLKYFGYVPPASPISSLPSRERGLKSVYNKLYESSLLVAPFAGAWIEIVSPAAVCILTKSLPSRERGLKLY